MNELVLRGKAADWHRLKGLVLDGVSSPITRRVYNLALDELIAWHGREPRPGFSKAVVSAWRVALKARGLGAISINVRITAARKLAVEACRTRYWHSPRRFRTGFILNDPEFSVDVASRLGPSLCREVVNNANTYCLLATFITSRPPTMRNWLRRPPKSNGCSPPSCKS